MNELYQVELELAVCRADEVVTADEPVDPPATADASDARSVANAEMTAMLSPADFDVVDEIDTPVCAATVSMAVNSAFHCEALIVSVAETVATADSPRPY